MVGGSVVCFGWVMLVLLFWTLCVFRGGAGADAVVVGAAAGAAPAEIGVL